MILGISGFLACTVASVCAAYTYLARASTSTLHSTTELIAGCPEGYYPSNSDVMQGRGNFIGYVNCPSIEKCAEHCNHMDGCLSFEFRKGAHCNAVTLMPSKKGQSDGWTT